MIRRSARLLLRGMAGLGAGLLILIAIAALRLWAGPVSLDFLAPYFADAITSAHPEFVVRIDHTLVGLEGGGEIEVGGARVPVRPRDPPAPPPPPAGSAAFADAAV